jgi:hypothetical protein
MSREWEREEPRDREDTRGYCGALPARDGSLDNAMREYLGSRGLSYLVATANLWYPSTAAGDKWPRMVIPGSSSVRHNYYWQARLMDTAVFPSVRPELRERTIAPIVRYMSPATRRGDAIVVCYPGVVGAASIDKVVVAEGPTDALAAASIGILGLGLMGLSPPDAALMQVVRYISSMDTYLIADADNPGAMAKILRSLIRLGSRAQMTITVPPSGDFAKADCNLRYKLIGEG